jgi:hypothetical protein
MPRRTKQYVRAPDVELDYMVGGGKKSNRALRKFGKDLNRGFKKDFIGNMTKGGVELGRLTNEQLLPAVKTIGIPLASTALGALGTYAGGPLGGILAEKISGDLLEKYVPGQSKNKYVKAMGDVLNMGMQASMGDVDVADMLTEQMVDRSMTAPRKPKRSKMDYQREMDLADMQYFQRPLIPSYDYDQTSPYRDMLEMMISKYQQPTEPLPNQSKMTSSFLTPQTVSDPSVFVDDKIIYSQGKLGPEADSILLQAPPYAQKEGSITGLLGSGIRRKRKPKSVTEMEIYVKKKLPTKTTSSFLSPTKTTSSFLSPHQKFSHARNSALDQLLEASHESESKAQKKAIREMVDRQTKMLKALGY